MRKRLFDIAGASFGLLLTAPLLLLIAALILFSSGRPVLFRQERIGKDGEPFTIYKFRTVHDGEFCPQAHLNSEQITAEGRWLRRTKLDELPQLVNVIKGNMSLVGPRPYATEEAEALKPHWQRHDVRPGLCGPGKLVGDAQEMERDTEYAQQPPSCWHDIRIIVRTIVAVSRGRIL